MESAYWPKLSTQTPKNGQSQHLLVTKAISLEDSRGFGIHESMLEVLPLLCSSVSLLWEKIRIFFFSYMFSTLSILCHVVRFLSRGMNCGTLNTTDVTETTHQTPR